MKICEGILMAVLLVVLFFTTLNFVFFSGLLLPLFGILFCIFLVLMIVLIEIWEVKKPSE